MARLGAVFQSPGNQNENGRFVGSITFEGDFEEFLPFLMLGEYIHVGKGTSFGLGKYEIEF